MADDSGQKDVQIFDVRKSLEERASSGRMDLATGDLSYIAIFQTAPRRGELAVHQHPDSDQILYVLSGQCAVTGLDGAEVVEGQEMLDSKDGILIPAGSYYGFSNFGDDDMFFLSMRTESSGGRRIAYVPDTPSGVRFKLPKGLPKGLPQGVLGADIEQRDLFAYVVDNRTIGVSVGPMQEWNRSSLLRASCWLRSEGDGFSVELPERITGWYEIGPLGEEAYRVVEVPGQPAVRIELAE